MNGIGEQINGTGGRMKMKNKFIEDGVMLSNGIKVTTYHDQDCCESVYANWAALEDTTFEDEKFTGVTIEKVPGSGFRINGYFVPCHNIQNGYYSDQLIMIIKYPDGSTSQLDITECNEDKIF